MDARFVLPVSIATALHALVLFGVKWPHPPALIGCTLSAVPTDLFSLPPDPPEPVETTETAAVAPKGEPKEFRPEQDETPPVPAIFEQESRPRPATPIHVTDRLSAAPVGVLEGVPVGGPVVDFVTSDVLDNAPRTRSQISPNYPSAERMAGITGDVMVEFIVDETGRVLRAHAISSSHAGFESAAVRAVEKWRFEPGKRNGRPVRFKMAIPIRFSLDQSSI